MLLWKLFKKQNIATTIFTSTFRYFLSPVLEPTLENKTTIKEAVVHQAIVALPSQSQIFEFFTLQALQVPRESFECLSCLPQSFTCCVWGRSKGSSLKALHIKVNSSFAQGELLLNSEGMHECFACYVLLQGSGPAWAPSNVSTFCSTKGRHWGVC